MQAAIRIPFELWPYLVSFLRWSEILVENGEFCRAMLCISAAYTFVPCLSICLSVCPAVRLVRLFCQKKY